MKDTAAGGAAGRTPEMVTEVLDLPCAWRGVDLAPADWRLEVGAEASAELTALSQELDSYEGPIEGLSPEAFELPATGRLMARARACLDRGIGFAVLDRLPIEGLSERTAKALIWLVISHLGPIVAQKRSGIRLYDVRDTGAKLQHGVRRSITNLEQEFHTDGGWLTAVPEVVALACLRQAAHGGVSRIASLVTAHNEMLRRHPGLLPHLYGTLWWDRQAEHPEDEAPCSRHPIYAWDGARLTARYYDDYVRQGHRLMAEPVPAETDEALAAVRDAIEAPGQALELRLEPGQVELVNNRLLAHGRSAFREAGNGGGRHLLRVWVRRGGGVDLEPSPAPAA